ncbi:MAG: 16S rRNA (uracil(1498)-N(3))-methyltransferase [SAR202 cluster bacterium]|nr:16S rRNA (uracil(1498)-N(3))-methyltransferase [SAR202 cluster bacterium]|tara:strand:- start:17574 stop:18317 length:744 start_codon:yes stop_codon:yes gene_type:complete
MNRFFVDPKHIKNDRVSINDEAAHQIHTVLRLKAGDNIMLLDNTGIEYLVTIEQASPTSVEARVLKTTKGLADPSIFIRLYQGIMKGSKFDLTLQKGTESGISSFVPTVCQRSEVKLTDGWFDRKINRWSTIVKEASEQTGRSYIPDVEHPTTLYEAFLHEKSFKLIAWEKESNVHLGEVIRNNEADILSRGLSIFIGPEGGFEDEEIRAAQNANISTVSLGRRMLRAETAGIIVSSLVLYQLGDLG